MRAPNGEKASTCGRQGNTIPNRVTEFENQNDDFWCVE
jgi:hypothetical protein